MSKSDTWPSHIAPESLSNMDSAGSCDSGISKDSACSEDSMEHLSPEERACLMFLEETIESLELQEDSGFSNEEPDLWSHVEKMEPMRKDDNSRLPSEDSERDQTSILSYAVPVQPSHLGAGPESPIESKTNHHALNHTPEPLLTSASGPETLDHVVPPPPPPRAPDSSLSSLAPQMNAPLLPPPSDFMDKQSSPTRPERLKYQHPSVGLSNSKPSTPVDLEQLRQRAIAPSVNLEKLRQRAASRKTSLAPSFTEDPPSKLYFDASQSFRPSSGSFSHHPVASDPPMSLPPVASDLPMSLPPVASDLPMNLLPVASDPPMSLPPVAYDLPKSLPPVASNLPMSLPPVAFDPPMSLPPVASDLPMSLDPVASDLPRSLPPVASDTTMSLPSITYDPPKSLPPVTYDPQTSFPPIASDPPMSLPPESPEPKTPPPVAPKPKRLPANILLKSYKTSAASSEGNSGLSVPTSGDRMSLDHQRVHMEALRKLGLLKSTEEDSAAGLSPKSRRSWTDPSPPLSPAASNTPPMTPSYSRANSSSPSAVRPQSMSPAALLLSATSTPSARPPPDFLPAPPAFSDFAESEEQSPVNNVNNSFDAVVANPPLTPTTLMKQLSPPRVIGTKSATLERSASRLKSYLARKNCEGSGDEQSPGDLRSSRPRPASLGSRTQFTHGDALQTGQATSSGPEYLESPPSPTDSQHSNDSQKLPRSQGISVVISPRAENEEDRREALKKLGLLRD